jgi:hypothetical protein
MIQSDLRSIKRIAQSLQWTEQELKTLVKKARLNYEINQSCLLSDIEKEILRNRIR